MFTGFPQIWKDNLDIGTWLKRFILALANKAARRWPTSYRRMVPPPASADQRLVGGQKFLTRLFIKPL